MGRGSHPAGSPRLSPEGDRIRDRLAGRVPDDLDFHVRFVVLLATCFAERTTDEGATREDLLCQADLLDVEPGHEAVSR